MYRAPFRSVYGDVSTICNKCAAAVTAGGCGINLGQWRMRSRSLRQALRLWRMGSGVMRQGTSISSPPLSSNLGKQQCTATGAVRRRGYSN